jgi:hypothetical protein
MDHQLLTFVQQGDLYNIVRCLDAGATPNVRLIDHARKQQYPRNSCLYCYNTPLELAIHRANLDIITLLISRSAYVDTHCLQLMSISCRTEPDFLNIQRTLFENIDAQTIHDTLTETHIFHDLKVDLRNYLAQNILCTLSKAGLPPQAVPPSLLPKFSVV